MLVTAEFKESGLLADQSPSNSTSQQSDLQSEGYSLNTSWGSAKDSFMAIKVML